MVRSLDMVLSNSNNAGTGFQRLSFLHPCSAFLEDTMQLSASGRVNNRKEADNAGQERELQLQSVAVGPRSRRKKNDDGRRHGNCVPPGFLPPFYLPRHRGAGCQMRRKSRRNSNSLTTPCHMLLTAIPERSRVGCLLYRRPINGRNRRLKMGFLVRSAWGKQNAEFLV